MTEQKFWELIEASWSDSPQLYEKRAEVLRTNKESLLEKLSQHLGGMFIKNYDNRLRLLDKEELTQFIRILEKKLFDIDRQDIHDFTDGSDDGFLYCRCFILGMGQQYYNMISDYPFKATFDVEAELFGFSAYGIFEERFGEEFDRNAIHCIETCSNENGGWRI